jgi:hypothetical protein
MCAPVFPTTLRYLVALLATLAGAGLQVHHGVTLGMGFTERGVWFLDVRFLPPEDFKPSPALEGPVWACGPRVFALIHTIRKDRVALVVRDRHLFFPWHRGWR